jgi:hypothetical protein
MGTTDNFDSSAESACALADTFPVIANATGRAATATLAKALSALGQAVDTTATTLSITQALHGNRVVTVSSAAPIAVTLPAAAGTGISYRFMVCVAATATQHTIKVANTVDVMQGIVVALTTSSANVIGYGCSATSNTITLNGTTTGGVVGDWWELVDIKSGLWQVQGYSSPTGTTATPFSHS